MDKILFNVRCPECHPDDGTGGNPWFRPQIVRLHFECANAHRITREVDVHPGLKCIRTEVVPDVAEQDEEG